MLLFFSLDDMKVLGVKLDRNSFFEGTFPLAAMYNHSCWPNCNAMYDEVIPLAEREITMETLQISLTSFGT